MFFLGSTPWLVSLQDTQFMNPVHFCGATLLNIVWVLTSANCVSGYSYPYETLQVVLGEYDMEEVEGWERTRTVSVIVIHSDYDPFSHANDIALIRIHTPVLYNERIRPINLPPCRYEDDFHPNPTNHYNCWNHDFDLHKVDEQLLDDVWHVITGWGRTAEANDMSSVVMKATVPLLSQAECAAAYPSMPLTQSMICAGNLTYGGLDPCQGDWGGPLISSSGYIRGVSSWGVGCGRPGLPAIYTDVAKYNNWICDIIVN
ncbi:hypothetical protein Pmani_013062 [Petrolisthes manimaculis]|uniref:Acrosin n=1 Tax=Petrolisthes manimaculis TaxID=1843537 RepID=A0AAE1U9Q0_9EUCA|nr:hypothetical protein Pmani_033962 [Petrolisthes manimaculis]KAK4315723.1 hypothetical protein Pmani_013062 [Petrolisthes manimaculis]